MGFFNRKTASSVMAENRRYAEVAAEEHRAAAEHHAALAAMYEQRIKRIDAANSVTAMVDRVTEAAGMKAAPGSALRRVGGV